jgi:hypothetical protein
VAQRQGDSASTAALFEQNLAAARLVGDPYSTGMSLQSLASIARAQGDDPRALVLHGEALACFSSLGDLGKVAWCLEGIAAVCVRDNPEQTGRLFAAADTLRTAVDVPLTEIERTDYDHAVSSLRTAMGEPAFDAAWQAGSALSVEAAIAEASDLAGRIPTA